MPLYIGDLLLFLRFLIVQGRHLTFTLQRRSTLPGFSNIAQFFGTARVPVILARIARGLLRIQALQRVLLDRAKRGRDLEWLGGYKIRPRRGQPRKPKARPPQGEAPEGEAPESQSRPRRPHPDAPPDPDNLPTLKQLEAEVRRRGIGATIAAICLDLGVAPELCQREFAMAMLDYIRGYRGYETYFLYRFYRRKSAIDPELDGSPPLRVPDRSSDVAKRVLGYAIGASWPVMPVFLPAEPISHTPAATGPP